MATKPTKQQRQACEHFAEALFLITEGARLDGRGRLERGDLEEIVRRISDACSAFGADEIIAGTLERRCRALGLPANTAEMLLLLEPGIPLLELLRQPDEVLKEQVAKLEEELGEV